MSSNCQTSVTGTCPPVSIETGLEVRAAQRERVSFFQTPYLSARVLVTGLLTGCQFSHTDTHQRTRTQLWTHFHLRGNWHQVIKQQEGLNMDLFFLWLWLQISWSSELSMVILTVSISNLGVVKLIFILLALTLLYSSDKWKYKMAYNMHRTF